MNRSFWNKDVGIKGKMLFGAMIAMLSAMLLFVVCGGDKKDNPITPPACTPPQVLQNGVCVDPTPNCTPPQVLLGGVCVDPTPNCTPPQVLQNGVCADPMPNCTGGQILVGSTCMCPSGQTWNGSTCIDENVCPGGMVMVGTSCQCPAGTSWNAAMEWCMEPTCPPGQTIQGGICVGSCTPPQVWNQATQSCGSPNAGVDMCLWDSGDCWAIKDAAERTSCARDGWIFTGGMQGVGTMCAGGTFTGTGKNQTPPTSVRPPLGCCRWSTGTTAGTTCSTVYLQSEVTDCGVGTNQFWPGAACPNNPPSNCPN